MARRDKRRAKSAGRQPLVEELEPRLLFSADAAALVADATLVVPVAEATPAQEVVLVDEAPATAQDVAAESLRHEVVFVDAGVDGYEALLEDLRAGSDESRSLEVVVLDPDRSGIEQISEALASYHYDLDAVHIVSHGTQGEVQLGNTWLSNENVGQHAQAIAGWGNALGAEADLLFYGCNLAGNSEGLSLVDSLSALTGADVAASTDTTGHALFGGNWELEHAQGAIESEIAFSVDLQQGWGHVMAVGVDNSSTGQSATPQGMTVSHLTSGTDRLMLVTVVTEMNAASDSISSITYNGANLFFVGTDDHSSASPSQLKIETWALVAPDTGTYNVVLNWVTEPKDATVGVMTFTGVDQTTPLGTYFSTEGLSTTASVVVNSAAGELVYGAVAVRKGTDATPGAGQTEYFDDNVANIQGAGSTEAGASSVTTSWNLDLNDKWVATGVSIKSTDQVAALSPVQDSYIQLGNPTTNAGASGSMVIDRESTDLQRALVQFDLSSIPAGSTITGATLKLEATAVGGSLTIETYQLLESWVEGSTTWNESSSGTGWGTPGGSFNATALDSITTSSTGQHTFDITALAQDWLDGAQQNYGVLVGSPDGGGNRTATYDSREGTVAPILEISYTPPTNVAPVIAVASPLAYTENDGAVVIDGTATATDADGLDFEDGTLTVDFTANGTANDRLSIRNQGSGAGQVGVSGSDVSYEGTVIGTFTGGTSGAVPLVITFDIDADETAVQAVLRNVTYQNVSEDPSTSARTVRFALTDGDTGTSNTETVTINVTAQNDPPVLANNSLTIDEGQTVVLGSGDLLSNDLDHAATALTYTVSGVTGGQFELVAASGSPITNFTQDDVDTGKVQFVHFGGEAAPTYSVTVSDGGAVDGPQAATITFTNLNDAPALANNSLTINEGQTVVLGSGDLLANDPDHAPAALTYTVTGVSFGQFEFVAASGSPITTFTQDDVNTGKVQFVHDGGEAAPAYTVTVNDGSLSDGPQAGTVTFTNLNDAPALANNSLTLNEGQTVVLGSGDLLTNDPDDAPADLDYTVSGITGGQFEFLAAPGSPITTFTQDDVNTGKVRFVHFGGETAPTYSVSVSDGSLSDGPQAATITFTNLNDAPALANNSLTLNEGQTVVLGSGDLLANDPDDAPADLDYTVSGITGGQFEFLAAPGSPITTFTQDDVNTGKVRFVHFGGEAAPTYSVTVDDGSLSDGPQAATITFTNLNDAPALANNSLTLNEGQTVVLGSGDLLANDPDDAPADLDYTVSGITGGQFEFLAAPGSPITTFTQDDVNTGKVRFVHFGGEAAPTYSVSVSDGSLSDGPQAATITFTNLNDAPALANNSLTLNEGQTVVLGSGDLLANDPDDAPADLDYTVSGITGGQFEFVAAPGSPITTFTQDDVNTGKVRFVHFGGEAAPTYSVTVDDGSLSDGPQAATITFTNLNDAPALANNSLTLNEGQTVVLGSGDLLTNDPDDAPADLDYTVSGITGGQFEFLAAPGSPITTFTQDDVNTGKVRFVHFGGEAAPTYSVTVDDGSLSDGPQAATITFTNLNDAPALANNSLTLNEGQTVVLGSGDLLTNDPDDAPADLDYTVSGITGGQFEFVAAPGSPITTFTQDDVNTGKVRFVHFGGEAAPSYSVTVDDGSLSDGPQAATITFTNLNDAPALANNSLTLNEGQTVVLGSGDLLANDPDDAPADLDYTVSGITGGQFEFVAAPGSPITTFTQDDVNTGKVRFVHFGGEAAPSYSVTVDDGSLSDGPQAATITFTNLNDAPVVDDLDSDTLAYFEGSGPLVIDQGTAALVSDPDSANFSGGELRLSIVAGNDPAEDVLSIQDVGTGLGQIGFSGGIVSYEGTTIGTAVGGSGGADLVISLNVSATPTAISALARNITYENTDAVAATLGSRTVEFRFDDGDTGLTIVDTTVTVFNSNVSPTISGTAAGQPVNDNATRDPFSAVTIGDADVPVQSLTVTVTLDDAAKGVLTNLGSFVDLTGGVYRFTGDAAAATTAIRALTFDPAENRAAVGSSETTTFTISVTDGVAPQVDNMLTTVVSTSINDAPTLGNGALAAEIEDTASPPGATVASLFGAGFSDVDLSSAFSGVAIVGNAAPAGEGVWEYSSDGTNWFAVGTVDDAGTALAVEDTSLLRFVPAGDFNGVPTDLVVRGLDETYVGGFSTTNSGESRMTVNTSAPGGTTPITAATSTLSTSITADNDAPVVGFNSLTISEGGSVVLSTADLSTTDVDSPATALTYTVSGLSGGQFELVAAPGSPINSFTQDDVDTGKVRFVHDGGEAAPAYSVTVSDGFLADGPVAATITFTNVNDAPSIATNSLTISEGQTVVLASGDLATTDVDSPATALTYTVTAVTGGQFELVASPGSSITSFTQDDVDTGKVQFAHGGGEAAPTYSLSVSDGFLADGPVAATITFTNVNDAPSLGTNALTISEGGTVLLGAGSLSATDPDDTAASLSFTISGVSGGQFERVSVPGVAITSFLQGEVTTGDIRFIHDGGEAAPAYSVSVSDGFLADGPAAAAITFSNVNDAPSIATNSLTISEGQTVAMGSGDLSTTDVDSPATALTYTVSTVTGGQFELVAAPGSAITTFTQDDVDTGKVQFVHDGNEAAPTYSLSVSDGGLSDGPVAATITFSNVNDAPTIATNSLTISEGQTVVLGSGDLSTTDVDSAATALTYTVTVVTGGQFELVAAPGSSVTTFTQDDVDTGKVQFVHDGGEVAPTYSLSVSDGFLADGPQAATITFTNVNDGPVLANNTLTIAEGATVVLGSGDLLANDPDHAPAALTYTVSAVAGGQFELVAAPGSPVTTFSQDDVDTGKVQFVHDGSETTPAYDVSVSDGALSDGPTAASITFNGVNDAPTITGTAGGQTLTDKATLTPFTGVTIADVDLPADTLTVDVVLDDAAKGVLTGAFTSLGGGVYRFSGDAASATSALQGLSFDPTENRVAVGSTETTTFTIQVDDGSAPQVSDATTSAVATSMNDAPTVSDVNLVVAEDAPAGTQVGSVVASDPDPGDALGYSFLSGNLGGAFAIDPATGAITVADPAAIDFEVNPAFNLTVQVQDGSLATDTAAANVAVSDVIEVVPPPDGGLPDPDPIDDPGPDDDPAPEDEGEEQRVDVAAPPSQVNAPLVAPPSGLALGSPERDRSDVGLAYELAQRLRTGGDAGELLTAARLGPAGDGFALDGALMRALDLMGIDMGATAEEEQQQLRFVLGVAEGGAAAMLAGFLTWFLRGGTLLSSLLSTLPIWSRIDPLPVLKVASANQAPIPTDDQDEEEREAGRILDDSRIPDADPMGPMPQPPSGI